MINGQKTWSTDAKRADFALCPTRTRWDVPKHKGISVFILDLTTPGVDMRPIEQINGGAEFCEEFLTDVVVPASNRVGEENEGWRVARGLLDIEHTWQGRRSGVAAAGGVADLVALAAERGLTGDVGVRRRIVDIHVATTAQSLAAQRISGGMSSGALAHGFGPIVKVGAAVLRQRRAELGKDLAGSMAAAWRPGEGHEERSARDLLSSRSATIAGGTNEVLRNNVSEQGLGLPEKPHPTASCRSTRCRTTDALAPTFTDERPAESTMGGTGCPAEAGGLTAQRSWSSEAGVPAIPDAGARRRLVRSEAAASLIRSRRAPDIRRPRGL